MPTITVITTINNVITLFMIADPSTSPSVRFENVAVDKPITADVEDALLEVITDGRVGEKQTYT